MYPFVESVKYHNGLYFNLECHQERFDFTRMTHYPEGEKIDLKSILKVPANLIPNQIYKCRIIYGKEVGELIYEPYAPRRIRQYYLVVCPNDLDYSYKYVNRNFFDEARKKLSPDEDFIYVHNGLITDTSYANLVFTDEKNYFTPSTPLLQGTRRALYLKEGRINEIEIKVSDLTKFRSFFIINAMLGIGETPVFSCDKLLLSHFQLKL